MPLDPLQERIARTALSLPEAHTLALDGGAAMIAHGFVTRVTKDIDHQRRRNSAISPAEGASSGISGSRSCPTAAMGSSRTGRLVIRAGPRDATRSRHNRPVPGRGRVRRPRDDCGLIDTFRALHPERIEHSWVGRTGDGYRYDHVHCTADLAAKLVSCDYLHQTRVDRLSDHSALSVRLAIEPSEPLITSAPATASAPPTLF